MVLFQSGRESIRGLAEQTSKALTCILPKPERMAQAHRHKPKDGRRVFALRGVYFTSALVLKSVVAAVDVTEI
jgi:hypothetical protein